MIVVVGVPAWRPAEPEGPAGLACGIALAAARRGARVEMVGRTGDDAAGDALLLALSRDGVGHVAMLRDAARATRLVLPAPDDGAGDPGAGDPGAGVPPTGPVLEAADVSLGLQYLTSFSVLVVADGVPDDAIGAAVEAAAFATAEIVLVVPAGTAVPPSLPESATVLAAPEEADAEAFASMVGAYAAALDTGVTPGAAFAAATADAGWEAIEAGR